MSEAHNNAEASIEEQLVAYLDGELDAETGRRIEGMLASDAQLRRTLQELDRSWELLGELDAPELAETFTQSTLEMVTVAASEDLQQYRAEAPRRRRRQWTIVGGGLLAAGLVGFLVAAWFKPDPNQQLIEDLPLLVNVEQYRQIDDFEFLQMLSREGLFVEEEGDETQ